MRFVVRSATLGMSLAAASLATALVTACASAPPNTQTDESRVRLQRAASEDQVLDVSTRTHDTREESDVTIPAVAAFDALPEAYRKLGIPSVAVIDTAGGVYTVGARYLRLHGSLGGVRLSTYIDCGSAPMHVPANSYDVVFSATTYVTPKEGGSTLHSMVTADARDPGGNGPPVRCASTGAFEKKVAELVSAQQ